MTSDPLRILWVAPREEHAELRRRLHVLQRDNIAISVVEQREADRMVSDTRIVEALLPAIPPTMAGMTNNVEIDLWKTAPTMTPHRGMNRAARRALARRREKR